MSTASPATSIETVHLSDRQPAVDHMCDAMLARLDRACGDVEKAGYLLAPDTLTGPRRAAVARPTRGRRHGPVTKRSFSGEGH